MLPAFQEVWVVDAATRETWVHQLPDSDGNWGHVEKIAPDTEIACPACPSVI